MEITYTYHAEENIIDRGIDKKLIEETLITPDETSDGKKGRKIAHKILNGKLLRVIYETEECCRKFNSINHLI